MDPEETCCEDESCGLHHGHTEGFPEGLPLVESIKWAIDNNGAVPVDWKEKKWCGSGLECFYAGAVPKGWEPERWVGYFIENVLFKKEQYGTTKPDSTSVRTSDAAIVTVLPKEKIAKAFLYDALGTMKNRRRKISVVKLDEHKASKAKNKRDPLYGLNWSRVEAQLADISSAVGEMLAKNEEQFKELMSPEEGSPSISDLLKESVLVDPAGNTMEISQDVNSDSLES